MSLRIKDPDLNDKLKQARFFVRGEYIKTRIDRIAFLTNGISQ